MFKQDPDERKYQICTKLELEILCEKIRQIEWDSAECTQAFTNSEFFLELKL